MAQRVNYEPSVDTSILELESMNVYRKYGLEALITSVPPFLLSKEVVEFYKNLKRSTVTLTKSTGEQVSFTFDVRAAVRSLFSLPHEGDNISTLTTAEVGETMGQILIQGEVSSTIFFRDINVFFKVPIKVMKQTFIAMLGSRNQVSLPSSASLLLCLGIFHGFGRRLFSPSSWRLPNRRRFGWAVRCQPSSSMQPEMKMLAGRPSRSTPFLSLPSRRRLRRRSAPKKKVIPRPRGNVSSASPSPRTPTPTPHTFFLTEAEVTSVLASKPTEVGLTPASAPTAELPRQELPPVLEEVEEEETSDCRITGSANFHDILLRSVQY